MKEHRSGAWNASPVERRARIAVTAWSLAWVVAFLVTDAAIDRAWVQGEAAVVTLTAGVALVGVVWLRSYARFIRRTDELMRKIQLDAMALAIGAGFVSGFTLILLDAAGIVDGRLGHVLTAMVAAYVGTVAIGLARFGGGSQ